MSNEQFSQDEQNLIQQLRTMPKPRIDVSIRATIQQEMIREFRILERPSTQTSHRSAHKTRFMMAVAAVVIIGVIGLGLIYTATQPPENVFTPVPPSPSNQVAIVPSATPPPLATDTLLPTAIVGVTATNTPELLTETAATEIPISVTPTADILDAQIVIEGPITQINNNVISVYDFNVELAPQHPILNLVNVGDIIHVEGNLGTNGAITATVIGNIPSETVTLPGATVNLEGPVEAIVDNLITVNGIQVQVDANDPLLQSLQVGNFVTIQGNFEQLGTTIVLVTVNITVINNVIVEGTPFCWYHDDAMGMGHWHCDGMGMGMGEPAMGMGDSMGMGR